MKDVCMRYGEVARQLVLISHKVELPKELESFTARFDMALPTQQERESIIKRVASEYTKEHPGARVQTDPKAFELLIQNLAGFRYQHRNAGPQRHLSRWRENQKRPAKCYASEIRTSQSRGHSTLRQYDTAKFSDVGGLENLKRWLSLRKPAFLNNADATHLDTPKGIMLIGVQGCGKSLAAKATAGIFGLPLLRLDFATL